MSSTTHWQMDGQSEWVNQSIEYYICCYAQVDQKDYIDHIDLGGFCSNATKHFAMGCSPFKLDASRAVLTPLALIARHACDQIEDLDVDKFMKMELHDVYNT